MAEWRGLQFLIKTSLRDLDGVAAGLGQDELERARDDARRPVRARDVQRPAPVGRRLIIPVAATGARNSRIRVAGRSFDDRNTQSEGPGVGDRATTQADVLKPVLLMR